MQPIRQRVLFIGIGVLCLLIIFNAALSYQQTRELKEAADWVAYSQKTLIAVEQLVSTVKDAETGQRGFLITDDPMFLEPYNDALANYEKRLDRIATLAEANPYQKESVSRLKGLAKARLDALARVLALRNDHGFDRARDAIRSGLGRDAMVNIRALAAEMEQHEGQLLEQRTQANRQVYRSNIVSGILVALLGLFGIGAFACLLRIHLNAQGKSAASIHEQRELLRATLASIGDAVIATDAQGHVTFLNPVAEHLTGASQDEATGKLLDDVFKIVNEETRKDVESPARRALREGKVVGLANHTVLISRDGTEWPIDDSAAPITTEAGKLSGAILVFREIKERKRQENELRVNIEALREANQRKDELMAELKDADRRKDEFLATLAHELRNPLSPLSNALQLWPSIENDHDELNRIRGMMERQIRQITRLINDLMDVSRISRGKIQLQKERIDLGTVISGAIESVQPLIDASGDRVTLALPAEPIFVEADVARLTQVFGNILHNAAKYAGRNGVIWVAADRQNGQVAVSIRDNGPGIPKNMLSQIFEMFKQVDQTTERSFGGLGIGLSLVKQLVELHGGTVEARSEGPGMGSEFIVTLPAQHSGQSSSTTHHVLHDVSSIPRHRILVVDDIEASATTLAMILKGKGQDVSTANDGESAIRQVLESKPDVVFLDISMPRMDGYEVARRLRRHDELKGLVLVALTGYGQDEDRRKAIEAGFNHHMVKPTSSEELTQLLLTLPHGD